MRKRVVFTGGHAGTTALATIEAFRKLPGAEECEICWIGPKYAFEGSKRRSLEFKTMPELGVKCVPIVSGKIQSKFTRYTVFAALKVPVGFVHALYLLIRLRPKVVLSFGGYAGVPVVIGAWFLRIPIVIHEQIAAAGLGNRLSAPFANEIAVARKDSMAFFPRRKVRRVGNPILADIAKLEPRDKMSKPPVLYVTGGSRGAVIINTALDGVLEELLADFCVIHQTGEVDEKKFKERRVRLRKGLQGRYECFALVDPREVYKIYERADAVIGRAGANTVSEVLAAGRPAIFIPIPWSIFNEQERNAQYAQKVGTARILQQERLTPQNLRKEIEALMENWKAMSKRGLSKKATVDEGAAERLAEMVLRRAG